MNVYCGCGAAAGRTKVLFITGYAEGALMDKGGLGKCTQIMIKPSQMNVLAARVQGMLGTVGMMGLGTSDLG